MVSVNTFCSFGWEWPYRPADSSPTRSKYLENIVSRDAPEGRIDVLMYWCIYLFPSSSHNSEPSPLRMKTGNGAVCSNVRVFPPGRLSRDSLCRRWDSGWRSTNRVTASRRAESIFDMAWWLKSLWDIMHVGYILWLYMSGEIPRADGRSGWSV